MKRITILISLAVLLCVLPACGGTVADSTGGDSIITDILPGEQRDERKETVEDAAEAAQEAGIDAAATGKPALPVESNAEGGSVPFEATVSELAGPWHLDPYRNDLSGFSSLFDAYAEFGASMEIRGGGQMSWYIGAEGGEGTYSVDGSLLTAELSRSVDEMPMTTEFDILHDGDEVYLGMHWTNGIVFWSWGDDDSASLSEDGALLFPGENVVELVNLRGDETTAYKLDDGRYINRTGTVFIFDGVDAWTDEDGVEWNKIVR